ncbi:MAG: hypothetical protein RIC35_01990 [Marinoscillum sp.]
MRNAVLLSIFSVMLLATKSEAQRFITSFGVTHSWGMPYEVVHAIEHDYWGYDVVHTSRIVQRGKVFFDVVLQRGDVFVSVNLGSNGRIYRRAVTYDYPFHNHVCSDFCGYRDVYYSTHTGVCNSHHHHGHNHVVYSRPVNYYGSGYAYGHYKQGYKKGKKNSNYGYGNNSRDRNDNSRLNSRDSKSSSRIAERRDSPSYNSRSGSSSGSTRATSSTSSSSTGVSGRSASTSRGRTN